MRARRTARRVDQIHDLLFAAVTIAAAAVSVGAVAFALFATALF